MSCILCRRIQTLFRLPMLFPRQFFPLSSGVSLYLCGLVDSIELGVQQAAVLIDKGEAQRVLDRLVNLTSKT